MSTRISIWVAWEIRFREKVFNTIRKKQIYNKKKKSEVPLRNQGSNLISAYHLVRVECTVEVLNLNGLINYSDQRGEAIHQDQGPSNSLFPFSKKNKKNPHSLLPSIRTCIHGIASSSTATARDYHPSFPNSRSLARIVRKFPIALGGMDYPFVFP